MAGYKTFGTSVILPASIDRFTRGIGVRHRWRTDTRPDPTAGYWCDDSGDIRLITFRDSSERDTQGLVPARQLLVRARDRETAEEVASLVHCGCLAAYPDILRLPESPPFVYELGSSGFDENRMGLLVNEFREYRQADVGVRAAKAAWGDMGAIYALHKFRFSLNLDSFTPHSADPRYGEVFGSKYEEPRQHVSAAFAVVAAYAVIEELGLEIRSSKAKPRFLEKKHWNPVVLDDALRRLERAGISGDDQIAWLRRGSPTRVEREIAPKFGVPCDWNREYGVRDKYLTIPEAVHYVSWLRNFVAAHKFRVQVTALSPYDVHNAQSVARRVLLGYLGLWAYLRTQIDTTD